MRDNGFIEKKSIPIKMEAWLPYLACPECKGILHFEASFLICDRCKKEYHINRGIPILLPDALREICQGEEENWLSMNTQLEQKYIDLDGDSFRQQMLVTSKEGHKAGIKNSFFWEKRLFRNLKDTFLQENSFKIWQERNRIVLSGLKNRLNLQDKVVLNIGPGTDTDLINLLEDERAEVMNCDVVEDSLRYLSSNGKELLTAGDIRNLPFQRETFDLVLAIDVIHHVHPINASLQEIDRVLKKGGVVCISELNRFHFIALLTKIPPRFVRKLLRKLLRRIHKANYRPYIGSPYERILSRDEVTTGLEEAGFTGIEVSVLNYLPTVFPRMLRNFLEPIVGYFPRAFAPIASRYFYTARK